MVEQLHIELMFWYLGGKTGLEAKVEGHSLPGRLL